MHQKKGIAIITGAAGFIGRHTCRHFTSHGWRVIGIDTLAPENAPILDIEAYYRLQLPHPDLTKILTKHNPSLCIHCAGRASVELSVSDPSSDFYSSTVMTFELLDALRKFAPECALIFLSSAAVYGNPETLPIRENHKIAPISPYGFHKWQCELLCKEFHDVFGLKTASVRIFSAYGPGLRRQVVWDIIQKILKNNNLVLRGTGEESRDFVHVKDLVNGLRLVATSAPQKGEIYNLSSGEEESIRSLADMILKLTNRQNVHLQFDGNVPKGTPVNWCSDVSKIRSIGYAPSITLERGLKTVVDWCISEMGDNV